MPRKIKWLSKQDTELIINNPSKLPIKQDKGIMIVCQKCDLPFRIIPCLDGIRKYCSVNCFRNRNKDLHNFYS